MARSRKSRIDRPCARRLSQTVSIRSAKREPQRLEGPGFHTLGRGGFKALGAYNEFGNTAGAAEWMTRNKTSAQAQAEGLRVYEAIRR